MAVPKTVLVVDDEEALRDSIVFDLRRRGRRALVAGNGVEALAVLRENAVDLVISDVRMPGGDGLAMLDEILGLGPKAPPVILVTGFSDASDQVCLARGARRVFAKPFDRKLFLDAIRELLGECP
jgi:CheY-like chemotaxis protein